jgi:hypothetical protein
MKQSILKSEITSFEKIVMFANFLVPKPSVAKF